MTEPTEAQKVELELHFLRDIFADLYAKLDDEPKRQFLETMRERSREAPLVIQRALAWVAENHTCPGCGEEHEYNVGRCHGCNMYVTIPCDTGHLDDCPRGRL